MGVSTEENELSATPPVERGGTYALREYLKTEVNNKHQSLERTVEDVVQRVRLMYSKLGNSKFHGHLELSGILFRATRRADVPVVFTRGFNPRPRFAFGPPLQLGVESTCELVDVFLSEKMNLHDLQMSLNAELPDGIQIVDILEVTINAPPIQVDLAPQAFIAQWTDEGVFPLSLYETWKTASISRIRKGKKREVPIARFVSKLDGNEKELRFEVTPEQDGSRIKPFEVVTGITGRDMHHFGIRRLR